MATVTTPKASIAIATVKIGGVAYECATSTEFVRFFDSIVNRIGGVAGASNEDLTLSQFEDAGIEESKALIFAAQDELRQDPPSAPFIPADDVSNEVASLREEVAALRTRLSALEQGITP